MNGPRQLVLVTCDLGLAAHWRKALGAKNARIASGLSDLSRRQRDGSTTIWVDDSISSPPNWRDTEWQALLAVPQVRVVATSSNPSDERAMDALDAGCAGYCHAYSDPSTLRQVQQVIDAGQVWIGKSLMQRLMHGTKQFARTAAAVDSNWGADLTTREREVAILAANGASNMAIATECSISERTVKAHLSAVFTKLNITDRLQLALRVHGIS
jgi:DNA-binding NarL/FixJ family response regulator